MDIEALAKQLIAVSVMCESIAAQLYEAKSESAENEERPGCEHPDGYRMPLSPRSNGKTGYVCKACNAVVYDVTVMREV